MQEEAKTEIEPELLQTIEKTVKKAVSDAVTEHKRAEKQKTLYNTRKLMESYGEMQKFIKNAISEELEVQEDVKLAFGGENTKLESVKRAKMRTAMMIANIDRAMEELEREHEKNGTEYKYKAFKMHYIDGLAYEDIAEELNCGKNSPSIWVKLLLKQMAVKLFGINGIEKF